MRYTRREFIKTAGGFVCASTLASQIPGLVEAAEKQRFNVLFLMTDQHHHSVMGCAGNPMVKTPNLDKLASQGARFTNAVCATPFCSPTRGSLITGLWPHTHGIVQNIGDNRKGFEGKIAAAEQILFDRGYYAAQMGKWHLGEAADLDCYEKSESGQLKDEYRAYLSGLSRANWPKPRNGEVREGDLAMLPEMAEVRKLDTANRKNPEETSRVGRLLVPAEHTYESWLTDHCIDLIKKHKDDNFMITWSVSPPHAPWIAPEPYYSMYDPAKIKLPKSFAQCPEVYRGSRARQMGRQMGERLIREQMRCYYAQVTMVDALVGRILKSLADQGLEKNTLVLFVADHGDMQAAHGMAGKSVNAFYDDIVRTPLMMRYPHVINPGTVIDAHANSVDIMPTLLEYAGVAVPKGVQGKSLKPLIEGRENGEDRLGFCERSNGGYTRMVRTSEWKYSVYEDGRRELFDLKNDPCEMEDLSSAPQHKAVMQDLHRKLRKHMEDTSDPALPGFPKA